MYKASGKWIVTKKKRKINSSIVSHLYNYMKERERERHSITNKNGQSEAFVPA